MNYLRQRLLQSVEPVTTLVVTLALAIAGANYWSLIIGIAAGQWLTAIVSVASSPYPVRFRYDRGTLKDYWSFSMPLLWGAASGIVIAQSSVLIGNAFLGVAGVGAIALASQVSQLSDRVDQIVTGTLYPAICAVRDRKDLLFESFVKSNRLALIWGVPFGVGVALFAEPLVVHVVGEHWRPAIPFLQVFGVVAGLNQLAFNWSAYLKAVGETKGIAIVGATTAAIFVASATGLTAAFGRDGFVISIGLMGVTSVIGRFAVMRGMFSGFRFVSHTLRAIAPTVPAAALVLALRSVDLGLADASRALVELAVYLLVVVIATWILERDLLREVLGYLRGRRDPTPVAPVPA
jgi:O-antigen/teichoic acid export membrane protein